MSQFKKIIPTLNRILVKKLEPTTKTSSGIILQKAQDNNYGVVIEAGPGLLNDKGDLIRMTVAVGDTVLLPEYGGTKVKLENQELFLFRDTDILAKMQ